MTDEPSLIRYYFDAEVTDESIVTGLSYLEAMAAAKLRVKPCPIGGAFLEGRWSKLMPLFTAPMPGARYVNVVCAGYGRSLGSPMRADHCDPRRGVRTAALGEEVYRPKTAFTGLYTVGVPNVAIVVGETRAEDEEIEALCRYTAVFTSTEVAADDLRHRGVSPVTKMRPDPYELSRLLGLLTDTL